MNMRHAAGHLGVPVFLLHLILDLTLSPGTGSTEGLAKDCVIQLLNLTLQLSISAPCLCQLGLQSLCSIISKLVAIVQNTSFDLYDCVS
jgi:hypothetical protein